jgi:ferric-dicitrate binding protein FerR (iron transport regulator)
MTSELESRLLDRFLAGEATPEEAAQVRAWVDASPDRAQFIEALRAQGASRAEWDVEKGWRSVQARRAWLALRTPRPIVRWAAAAAVLLGVAVSSWRMLPAVRGTEHASAGEWREVAVPRGTRGRIDLPDGSTVTLNAASRLRYRAGADSAAREVVLDGEAFFVVKHDASRPFRVRASRATVEDVGTRFVVSSYAGSAPTVVVAEGAVALRATRAGNAGGARLTAGMLGRLEPTDSVATRRVDAARYTAWTDGRLILDNATLDVAAMTLERWFDVDVRLADAALATRRVNAEFRGESLADVLATLSAALDLEVRRDGRRVTIAARGAAK